MQVTAQLAEQVGVQAACDALAVSRATFYRRRQPAPAPRPRPRPPLALGPEERKVVLDTLHSPRFIDSSPRQVWATLADEDGVVLCSVRTMYRILASEGEVRERRRQARHPSYVKPELLATSPNALWSWDITKLKGPAKWTSYHLYVILDVFSRYVVGWMVMDRESGPLAKRLIAETFEKQGVGEDQLTLHADRGSSMTSKVVAHLLSDLGVTKTHSRPQTSNDNPFSESQFKTMKYHPHFPERFGSIEDARSFCQTFFDWYNTQHRHSSLALLTASDVHHGRAEEILERRSEALQAAFAANPERYKGRAPKAGELPEAVWINPPEPVKEDES